MSVRSPRALRTVPVLIVACLLALPAPAKYSGGTGEPNDPYQIATAADLIALGETPKDYGKHFILIKDIDLDPNLPGRKVFNQGNRMWALQQCGMGFQPMNHRQDADATESHGQNARATSVPNAHMQLPWVFNKAVIAPDIEPNDYWSNFQGTCFRGVFDGKGHTISHLTIRGEGYLGLFGQVGLSDAPSGEVRDLGVVDVNIIGSGYAVGGLVGYNEFGTVTQCYSSGAIDGNDYVGGLVIAARMTRLACSNGMVVNDIV